MLIVEQFGWAVTENYIYSRSKEVDTPKEEAGRKERKFQLIAHI